MIRNYSRLLTLVFLPLAVTACATSGPGEEALLQEGAVRLNPDQVRAHVTGKTESWRHGGGYYKDETNIRVKWLKAYQNGTWQVKDDGTLCFELPSFSRCHFYMNKDGKILMMDEGINMGERVMYDGDNLNALGRYPAGSGRKR